MINYGTHATIKIGRKVVKEYFDIANIEHYDVILGTPFLRKMGIVLDFRSPGMAWIGNEVIPTGKVFFDESKDTFPVSITSLPIWAMPGLLKSRTIPIFLRNGVPRIAS